MIYVGNVSTLIQPNKGNNMNTTTTAIEVDTRASKDADSIKTNLTIDWDGMTEEDLRALAQQQLIVKLQGAWRKNGIPEGDHTVKASDYKVGVRAKREPANAAALLAAMSPDERRKVLEKYLADLEG